MTRSLHADGVCRVGDLAVDDAVPARVDGPHHPADGKEGQAQTDHQEDDDEGHRGKIIGAGSSHIGYGAVAGSCPLSDLQGGGEWRSTEMSLSVELVWVGEADGKRQCEGGGVIGSHLSKDTVGWRPHLPIRARCLWGGEGGGEATVSTPLECLNG